MFAIFGQNKFELRLCGSKEDIKETNNPSVQILHLYKNKDRRLNFKDLDKLR